MVGAQQGMCNTGIATTTAMEQSYRTNVNQKSLFTQFPAAQLSRDRIHGAETFLLPPGLAGDESKGTEHNGFPRGKALGPSVEL